MPATPPPRNSQPVRRPAPARPAAPASRAQLTPEQRQQQMLLKKIKRLNDKLAKIKGVAVNMHTTSTRTNEVSARQVEAWSQKILAELNGEK